ncbi:AsmA family protein [Bradyrhizobium sp.]|uniref:AsmA family protein n=1 Tax=Bradyrhizobium sp. TaxID=376 RepID=UPI0026173DFE|nr:AsmA family protein [Bradyrhizobium sp.]
MRALKIAGGVIAAMVVVAALLLIVGMPAGSLTSSIQQRVARETGYRLTVKGSTRVGLWPWLNVTMSEVTLQPPKDRDTEDHDTGHRLTIGSLRADLTLRSLWSGQPDITELVINRPTASIPLLRERRAVAKSTSAAPAAPPEAATSSATTIKRIAVTEGTVIFFNTHDRVEEHIEGISANATIGADRHLNLDGNARAGGHPLTFNLKASLGDPSMQRQTLPAEFSLEAPGLLQAPLSSKAELRINGSTVLINSLSGTIGNGAFDGWASVDFASKPLVKLDLDFKRLDIAAAATQARPEAAANAWSTETIELAWLNYVDAQVRLSADELNIGRAHFAPAAIEASLESGILKGTLSDIGAYGGKANGTVDIDVSQETPVYTIHSDLSGVRALPLLSSTAGFDKLDGKLQAKIDVRSNGQSQQAIMSNLSGTVKANFADGAIRGLNVAQMIRSLTSGTLSGWQEGQEKATDLSRLSASFRIDKGQAKTTDLNLVGPLVKMTGTGTVDLGAQTLALRVEPKLVMSTEGQGRTSDPVAFGIPVVIDGPWTAPRINLDDAGNDNNTTGGNSLGDTLGKLIQQGLDAARGRNSPDASPNDPSRQQDSQPLNDIMKQLFGR